MRRGEDVMRRSSYKRRISRSTGRSAGSPIHQPRAIPPARDAHSDGSRVDGGGRLCALTVRRMSWLWSMALIAIAVVIVPATSQAAPHAKPGTGGGAAPVEPRGWANPRALELAKEAIEAKKAN